MKRPARSLGQRQVGFTIVELMVAMTLSLILLGGALSILYGSKLTYSENDRLARIQEAGRAAMELILQDTRTAGYVGCSRPVGGTTAIFDNTGLSDPGSVLWNFAIPVAGFESTGVNTWAPAIDATVLTNPAPSSGNDLMILHSARPNSPVFRMNASMGSSGDSVSVDIDPARPLAVPATAVISDCRGAATFVATAFNATGSTATLDHGTGTTPGNVSANLVRTFGAGSLITPVQTVVYYIAADPSGVPTLWRILAPDPQNPAVSSLPVALVAGVEGMQVLYGVDTDGDNLANNYVQADAVADWTTIVSINVALLVRSVDEYGTERDRRTYTLLGISYGPYNDRRQRQVFSTTIALRNYAQ